MFYQSYLRVVWCTLKWKKIIFNTIHFTAFDEAQVALLGLMECVHLSEKTKSVLKFPSPACPSFNSGSSGRIEHFNGCGFGFTALATTRTVMQHRSCSRWESFLASVSEWSSYREWSLDLTFERRFGRKPHCVTPLASGLHSLPLVALAGA